jgi:hypothetical protein
MPAGEANMQQPSDDQDEDHLSSLPNEIRAYLFGFLPPRDQLIMRLVNKAARATPLDLQPEPFRQASDAYRLFVFSMELASGEAARNFFTTEECRSVVEAEIELILIIALVFASDGGVRQERVDALFLRLCRITGCNPANIKMLMTMNLPASVEWTPSDQAFNTANSRPHRSDP